MKTVKAHLQETKPDRVDAFEKGAQAFAKKLVANFKDYEFYTGENMNPDGMVALLNYREDGVTRTFLLAVRARNTADHDRSLLHLLEGWSQGDQALDVPLARIPSTSDPFASTYGAYLVVYQSVSVGREVSASLYPPKVASVPTMDCMSHHRTCIQRSARGTYYLVNTQVTQ